MKKTVVVTGSNGLLGQSLLTLLLSNTEKYKVFGLSRGENRSRRTDFSYVSLDLTDASLLSASLETIAPDVIIHTAAMTQVDACEDDRDACWKLNVSVVDTLISHCEQTGAYLVHLSTDFIFDGADGPYAEDAAPNPLSYYGLSKLTAEQRIQSSGIQFSILRTILVFGLVADMSRSNIVLWVKKSLEEGQTLTIVDDQYRMPTYVDELARACQLAIDQKKQGVFHISSSELLSIYEIAQQIAEVFDLDASYIKPISSATLSQKAARPPKTGFDLTKAKTELGFMPNTFREDLQRFKIKLMQN